MPVVLRVGPVYRFYFYSADSGEPRHVHIDRDRQRAKFWLDPISLAFNRGFQQSELRAIRKIVDDHQDTLRREWDAYFPDQTP